MYTEQTLTMVNFIPFLSLLLLENIFRETWIHGPLSLAIMYCSEYQDYHLLLALNIFNVVCSTENYSGLNAKLAIISFEHSQLNGHGLRVRVSLILFNSSFCTVMFRRGLHMLTLSYK